MNSQPEQARAGIPVAEVFSGLRLALVGPIAPPLGGMARQCDELLRRLRAAGAQAELLVDNAAYRPRWVAGWRGWRALCRLIPYLWQLWRVCGRVQVVHIMANSGWNWHLKAAPAIWIARWRGAGILLNYRGGAGASLLQSNTWLVLASLRRCHAIIVPSAYLQEVFARYQLASVVIPNVLDTQCYFAGSPERNPMPATLLMTRHLEALYDHASAIRALKLVHASMPTVRLQICGDGPQRAALEQLVDQLGLRGSVEFTGALSAAAIAPLYRQARALLNTSLIDNAPNTIVEAWASGLPVISTAVGGIPHLVTDEVDALLCPAGDVAALARQILRVLQSPALADRLSCAGQLRAAQHHWQHLLPCWQAQYQRILLRPQHTAYSYLVAKLLFPLQEKLKHHATVARLAELELSQWQTPDRLAEHQDRRLRQLLRHAVTHVPYYRNASTAGYRALQQVRTVGDLVHLPVLRKADIRSHAGGLVSEAATRLKVMSTGGSSGEPLQFSLGMERITHDVAARWRSMHWWGVVPGEREALMWGSPIELGKQDRLRLWRDRIFRSQLLPAFDLKATTLHCYVQHILGVRPRILSGYPSALCTLASYASEHGIRLDTAGIKVIFVTAERLYPQQRELLERSFAAPVANGYGSREGGFVAHQCPAGGMHISAEDILIEILDEQGQPLPAGQVGEIVLTHLASKDFPLIRYATGDRAALEPAPCICGRSLPLMREIEGRSTDFIIACDGTPMHGLALIYILRELPYVRQFRIIQEAADLLTIQLVLAADTTADLQNTIVAPIRQRVGQSMRIELQLQQELAVEPSGKFRYIVNRMPAQQIGASHAA